MMWQMFAGSENLASHMRSHSLEKSFQCTVLATDPYIHKTLLLLLLQNLYSGQIQASSSQRRWRIARWGTWLAGVGYSRIHSGEKPIKTIYMSHV